MSGDQARGNLESSAAEPLEQKIVPVQTLTNFDKPSNIVITANGLKIQSNLNPYASEFYPSSLKNKPETQANEEIKKLIFKDAKESENCVQSRQLGIENPLENLHKIPEEKQQQETEELKSVSVDETSVIPNIIPAPKTEEEQQRFKEMGELKTVLVNETKVIPDKVLIHKPDDKHANLKETQELKPTLVEETKVIPKEIETQKTEAKQKSSPATPTQATKELKRFEKVVAVRSRLNTIQKSKASNSLMNSSKHAESSKTTTPKTNSNNTNKPCSSSSLKSAIKQNPKAETVKNKDTLSQKSSSSTDKSSLSIRSCVKSNIKKVEQPDQKNPEKDSKLKKPIPPKTPRSTIASNLRKTETQNVS